MTDEYKQFKNNIRSIASQEVNTAYPLVGKIVNYSSSMEFCDVEVTVAGQKRTYPNVPAHGFPVIGSSGIIHFHNGNLEQPVCDCAYRMSPPNETLNEYYTFQCNNWLDNGNFFNGTEGYNTSEGLEEPTLYEGENITKSGTSCQLAKQGDILEIDVDISECTSTYFKFQCNYMGAGTLKIECMDNDTGKIIPNMPYTIGGDYKIWHNPHGRFGWSYNKEVYPRVSEDGEVHKNIKIRITNYSDDLEDIESATGNTYKAPHSMLIDGLLVYEENPDKKYYPSVNDRKKIYSLML